MLLPKERSGTKNAGQKKEGPFSLIPEKKVIRHPGGKQLGCNVPYLYELKKTHT